MLRRLKISNYALIEELDIEIKSGLSVITGETGAGKSIIMGALSLIAGQRADVKVISKDAKKCIIEAEFFIEGYNLQGVFMDIDVDYDTITTIRREILETGKSRAFINDTPCSLASLKLLMARLVDIHSQHANLLLNDSKFQIDILDSYSEADSKLQAYREAYKVYNKEKEALHDFKTKAEAILQEKDYIQFQYEQLDDAKLIEGELVQLEQENNTLEHSEEIKTEMYRGLSAINGDDRGILNLLKEITTSVKKVAQYVDGGELFVSRLDSIFIETKDLSHEFETIAENLDFDPKRKIYVEDRLNLLYSLMQKHQVDNVEELIVLCDDYAKKINDILDFDIDIERLEKSVAEKCKVMGECAKALSVKRKSVVKDIESLLIDKLVFLGIENARCEVQVKETETYNINGKDEVIFMFSANKNSDMYPISSIASGGEMSRVMLCLKSIMASKLLLHTIIFDEIDSGVSGEIANRMGEMMSNISNDMQVITITHLPQIASKGKTHYKVYKEDIEERTVSNIIELNDDSRVLEIAEMLSGKNPTKTAIDNAKSLLFEN